MDKEIFNELERIESRKKEILNDAANELNRILDSLRNIGIEIYDDNRDDESSISFSYKYGKMIFSY